MNFDQCDRRAVYLCYFGKLHGELLFRMFSLCSVFLLDPGQVDYFSASINYHCMFLCTILVINKLTYSLEFYFPVQCLFVYDPSWSS